MTIALVCARCKCLLRDGETPPLIVDGNVIKERAFAHGECVECLCKRFDDSFESDEKPAFFMSEHQLDCDIGTRGYLIDEDGHRIGPVWSRKPMRWNPDV